jgi:hypothetical protein
MSLRRRRSETLVDSLRDLYQREANAAGDQALRPGEQVSPDKLASLEQLSRLIQVVRAAQPRPRRDWIAAAALIATLLIASVLLFGRVPVTDVDLDLRVSEVSFEVPEQQELTKAVALTALGAWGLRDVQLPGASALGPHAGASADGDVAVYLSAMSAGDRNGTIDFAELIVPARTRITIQMTDTPRHFRLTLDVPRGADLELQVSLQGPVRLGLAGEPTASVDFATPKALLLEPGAERVELDWTLPAVPATPFTADLAAVQLGLMRVESLADPRRTVVRHASTILAGTVYFQSLNGRELALRAGEQIEFAQSRGALRALELRADGIALRFAGEVRGMTDGSASVRWSLMPTWLDWLRERQGLSLLWGTALYLLGLVTTLLRWWRGEE